MSDIRDKKEFIEAYFLLHQTKEFFEYIEKQKGEILNWEEDLEEIGFNDLDIQVRAFLKKYKKSVVWDI